MLTICSVPDCYELFKTNVDKCQFSHSGVQTQHNPDSNSNSIACMEHNASHHLISKYMGRHTLIFVIGLISKWTGNHCEAVVNSVLINNICIYTFILYIIPVNCIVFSSLCNSMCRQTQEILTFYNLSCKRPHTHLHHSARIPLFPYPMGWEYLYYKCQNCSWVWTPLW